MKYISKERLLGTSTFTADLIPRAHMDTTKKFLPI